MATDKSRAMKQKQRKFSPKPGKKMSKKAAIKGRGHNRVKIKK